jgi:3-oxoacyl-[acyl-carrier protein] reductase
MGSVLTDARRGEPRTVVVTGGARGIGLACSRAFVAAGDRVASLSRSGATDEVLCIPCDIGDADQVDDAFAKVEAELGPVQVVVANAGVTRDTLLARMSDDDFRSVLDTNLVGTFRVALSGGPGQANYAASKAGMIGLARSIAREYGSRNITANVVAPGPIATDMLEAAGDKRVAEIKSQVPAGRLGTPEDVAATVRFLASDEAGYITGAVVPVDGGMGMGH